MVRCTALVLAVLGLVACQRAPYTRRSQLILVSPEEETKLGAQAFSEVLDKSRVDDRQVANRPVEDVGRRIGRVADRPDYRWRFAVIDDPKQVNAFALPGGEAAVYAGPFPLAPDQHGRAVVLGHDTAHALAR